MTGKSAQVPSRIFAARNPRGRLIVRALEEEATMFLAGSAMNAGSRGPADVQGRGFPAAPIAHVARLHGPTNAAPESSLAWNIHEWEFK